MYTMHKRGPFTPYGQTSSKVLATGMTGNKTDASRQTLHMNGAANACITCPPYLRNATPVLNKTCSVPETPNVTLRYTPGWP